MVHVVERPTPPPTADHWIRCPNRACNQRLAQREGDCIVVHHKRRRLICREVVTIECDQCGAIWKPGDER